ncbi:MAG: hypothetical protein J6C85_00405 [Alphaproteobacteria bacterium]|nr:hypothetical protein [Alphaproteobacteria bacterium]
MKKIKKLFRFCFISVLVLIVFLFLGRIIFRLLWNFDILSAVSYQKMQNYWESGGVFNTFKDCSLLGSLLLFPIIWLHASYKLYKYGLGKFLTRPIILLYRRLTRPKVMEVEHVSIKNMGSKDKTLDEIISEKLKSEGKQGSSAHLSKDLRKQIAAKIGENEKQ